MANEYLLNSIGKNSLNEDEEEKDYDEDLIKKRICKIEYGENKGNGFFCKIPNPSEDNKSLNVLLTSYHVAKIEDKIKILYYNIENKKNALNLEKRQIWYNEELDYTCIEILKGDNNIEEYFDIDENSIDKNQEEYLKSVYFSFEDIPNLVFDSKDIIEFGNNSFKFKNNIETTFLGGPIFNWNNKRVIAIHNGFNEKEKYNIGLFIKSILDDINKKTMKKKVIIGLVICGIVVLIIITILLLVILLKNNDQKDKNEICQNEDCSYFEKNEGESYKNNLKYTIKENGIYLICVYGGNAKKGGKGGAQCAERFFKQGDNINFILGGSKSGGEGGKDCGWNNGDGHNGAGLSSATSTNFEIVAGGGGGDSESGNKGGDYEEKGKGKYGGGGAKETEPGRRGDSNANENEDGKRNYGGKGRGNGSYGKFCGGGGGDGYYGGGAGDYGNKGEDGGGGGGSNYCKKEVGTNCFKGNKNQYDFSGAIIYKKD